MARTSALIALVQHVWHRVSCSNETLTNAPKYYETHQNMSLGFNGVDRMRSLRKITTWLRGTNFCINCTSSPYFASSYIQLWNDPKCTQHYATHPNMSLRSNGADWVRSLRKIPMWLHGTNFCINCTNSPRSAPSFKQLRNIKKCTQTLYNATKHEFMVQWSGLDVFVAKNPDMTSWHELLH